MFEWYDFYLYGTLAVFFGGLFFPPGNERAALLASLATFGAGFGVRPLGAMVFGRIGDLIGRKYTFLVTVVTMGLATALIGFLPTYAQIGLCGARACWSCLRLLQGLALGGEYGGAATYVAEHVPDDQRGYYTSYIQTTATLGFFISLGVIGATRAVLRRRRTSSAFGWRVPFLLSFVLLGVSLYIRLKMDESPLFAKLKSDGQGLEESAQGELRQQDEPQVRAARAVRRHGGPGRRLVHGPVLRAHVPAEAAQPRLAAGLHAGRHRAGARHAVLRRVRQALRPHRPQEDHADAAACSRRVTYVPIYMAHHARWRTRTWRPPSTRCRWPTGRARRAARAADACTSAMVYGPIAAFLVELFPTSIRYTSMSLPYHLGNGWFGGFLPLIATATTTSAWAADDLRRAARSTPASSIRSRSALMTVVIGGLFINETKDHKIDTPIR